MLLPHLAARLFGVPLAIHRPKLDVILSVLGTRIGLSELAAPCGFVATPRAPVSPAGHIAVIPIHGTLVRRTQGLEAESGLTSYAGIGTALDTALANPDIRAIVLDIDSPGGESGGVFDLADRIRAATREKPVWAVASDTAFSAAYALASAASRVLVTRTGGVGSIGVIAMHVDQSAKDARDGLHYTAVYAGARKNDLNPHTPMTDVAQATLQQEVDRIYALFVDTVARHRHLTPEAVRASEAGLFFGHDAVAAGFADAIGTLDDALAELAALPHPAAPRHSLSGAVTDASDLFRSPPPESSMTESTDPAPQAPAAPALSAPEISPSVPSTAPATPMADALEIAQTCQLAGRPDLIAGFLEAGATPTDVRRQLLAAQAESSPEIVSRLVPDVVQTSATSPVIEAARRIAAQTSVSKEL